jgi:acyl-CoA synthetase (NDP forming)
MTPGQHGNLKRLLSPRSIACIGGDDAAFAIERCREAGFAGPMWGVNPRRETLGGLPCFPAVEQLPGAPDAVFLAVPAASAIETVAALRIGQAGGVVCFTAGFGELGEEGARLERKLVEAAGDLALVGPNCSGLLNFVGNARLWPFSHRGMHVDKGVAFITQSGMLGNTMTLNRRSVSFAYIISSGNQAMLGVEDYLEVLVDDPAVSGIGLYIESLRDVPRFADAAIRCLKKGIPIVVQKAGSSEIGSRLTVTHTGSLSGADELYQALFDRLGVVRVSSPVMLLETLKMLTVAGAPKGNRVAAFTCSGGDATMIADQGEKLGLSFPQPSPGVAKDLEKRLPEIATVSNPLDYTTPLWGNDSQLPDVIRSMLSDGYDSALMVQDYIDPEVGASNKEYVADARSFIAATKEAGIPAAICSCLPENLDGGARSMMIKGGIAPLQGIQVALNALANAATHGMRRDRVLSGRDDVVLVLPTPLGFSGATQVLDEWQGKQRLQAAGIAVPQGVLAEAEDASDAAHRIGFPVAVKMVSAGLPHKTEAGALKIGLCSAEEVSAAVASIRDAVHKYAPDAVTSTFLIERMIQDPVAEILLGISHDPQFGQAMVLASGGTLVELVRDPKTILLPTDRSTVADALSALRVSTLLDGYRGRSGCDRERVVDCILKVARFAESIRDELVELDINPLMILPTGAVAVDTLFRVAASSPHIAPDRP